MAKKKKSDELVNANKELAFQDIEKEKRAAELAIANKELAFQGEEKEKRAAELIIANKELVFQNEEKEKRAAELIIANKELVFQNEEKEKRAAELLTTNNELNQSEKLLQNSLKEVSDYKDALDATTIIALTDEKGIIKKANSNFCTISKYSEKELIGQDHRIINSGYHSKEFMHDLWETIKNGKIWKGELKNKAKDGTYYWVDTTIVPFLNEQGKPYQYLAIRVDISNRKESEEKLKTVNKELVFQTGEKEKRAAELVIADIELAFQNKEKEKREIVTKELEGLSYSAKLASQYARSLIEASRDPLFTISPAGKITDMNEATVRVTGESREKLIGSDFYNYFTEPTKAKEGYEKVFAEGFVVDYPLTIRDHKQTDVLFNGSVYKDDKGQVLGAVVVARDITEQKRIEKELTEAKVFAELSTEIAEEAKSKAEDATRVAEDAVKSKQQFLSNMSHEIRTPMNAIIGFTKVVLKTDLNAKQKEYLTAIKMSGDALIVLINDILDLAKVDAGKMTFVQTPFKMALSLSAMLHLFETKIQEKNLVLIKEYDRNIPEVLVGDPVRLHQIILNLVSNAVKFTTKGTITVAVRLLKEDSESATLEFAVTDTGIGIPKNKIEKIFENFQQATSGTSRLYGGTGLGLAIVKQLVEPQGGSIHVTSKVDEGSTFSFTLTFLKTKAEAELEVPLVELDTEIKNIKVLVVEDIALNQLLMKTLLDDFGFERDIAANGKIAIEKLQTKSYDIILMDLQMPEMNGFEATAYIRNTLNSKIPIIALTADVTTVDLAKCKAVGMNDYIAKPVDEKLLYTKIIGLVKKPTPMKSITEKESLGEQTKKAKCIDLQYLLHRTKSNPQLMMEMISLYLEQTPPLISIMKNSLEKKDWASLHAAVHKMIPSFSIMGISSDFENKAKKIQEYARSQQETHGIPDLVLELESICKQACDELTEEFNTIKNTNL
jgi:PAS domain S-box-containing protein